MYIFCPEGIQPCNMKILLFEDDTRYRKNCTKDNDVQLGFLWSHTVLPITISYSIIFYWILLTFWNTFPFKGDFRFRKSQKSHGAKSGLQGLSHLGDLMFCLKTLHETWCMRGIVVTMKLPITRCTQLQPSESSK